MIDHDEQTPLMKQYWELKAQAEGALMFFRMGDFYELFGDDAVTAAKLLSITLTSRDKNKPNPMPMCGVPHHSSQSYVQKLLQNGRKVAIAEQTEDPALVKGKAIVKREITRIFTPAVQFDQEGAETAFLATAIPDQGTKDQNSWRLACLDPSTGESKLSDAISADILYSELLRLPIKHFLRIGNRLPEQAVSLLTNSDKILFEDIPSNYQTPEQSERILKDHFGVGSLDAFVKDGSAMHAWGLLVRYAARTQQQERLGHLRPPQPLHAPRTLELAGRATRHLDLIANDDGTPGLFELINKTKSAVGARQLKRWLLEPLKDPKEIEERQTSVRELANASEKLAQELASLYDLERISGRVTARLANPRDTLALGRSLALLPNVIQILKTTQAPLLKTMTGKLQDLEAGLAPLCARIIQTQREDAPFTARDAGIFKTGTAPELDRLIGLTENGQRWLIDLEARERADTGISSLKVKYTRVFGYFIEVTQAHLKNVPTHYQRKQTTVGAERFFTEELKKFEEEILTAAERQKAMELQLFEQLVGDIQQQTTPIMEVARLLAELDALLSMSQLAKEPGWVFPKIDNSLDLEISAGRHPLVDASAPGLFVPNDTRLSDSSRLTLLITGPNMGGKSTVMRQVALIIILGQMGAPVPAQSARWGAVSQMHTRIGAHDAIARGQSTFMVEMTELAHILHHADERSFIVLDEIGRGTSTYDGISVAWATLEWICKKIRCRTLFATHYHELTMLATSLPLVANAHMAVEGARALKGGNLRFLYELREGPANESFGVHVAQLAGLPAPVIDRSWKILEELEHHAVLGRNPKEQTAQLSLFSVQPAATPAPTPASEPPKECQKPDPTREAVIKEISTLALDEFTPLQALNLLARLQKDLTCSITGKSLH